METHMAGYLRKTHSPSFFFFLTGSKWVLYLTSEGSFFIIISVQLLFVQIGSLSSSVPTRWINGRGINRHHSNHSGFVKPWCKIIMGMGVGTKSLEKLTDSNRPSCFRVRVNRMVSMGWLTLSLDMTWQLESSSLANTVDVPPIEIRWATVVQVTSRHFSGFLPVSACVHRSKDKNIFVIRQRTSDSLQDK